MAAFAEALASLTLEDERLRVSEGRGPVETMAESLGNQGPRGGVVSTLGVVYVDEDLNALVLLDAALENARCAALDGLVVDDVVGRRPTLHLPGLGLVRGKCSTLQEG